ncbi:TSL-kinase interacting protein 1 isoform X4 [Helianthus annuus]|uniref:TSL-kinase interacting protein 1 isoform X4 n=1 Tax=Helianthus annuus TaxID=4232 RepID=UPI000B8FC928|nr:TSL-kinase interacting protein 1 isoform X4 [Helianthus annuus]
MRVAMKANVHRKENIAPPPGRNIVATSKVKKGTTAQKRSARKASGVLSVSATEVVNRQLSVSEGCIGTKKEVDPLTKIKLQLFPVDEVTRIGLEKDGLNPFLELTLKARKKISSVIKHIHTKWGGSHIAVGEPMLLPYDTHLRHSPMSRRWTSKDSSISAGDVYMAVQSPAIFRLSYGWFSDHQPERVSATTDVHNCIKSDGIHKSISEDRNCVDATAQVAVTAPLVNDTEVKIGQSQESSRLMDDNMTDLTMGGLFTLEGNNDTEVKTGQSQDWSKPSTDISIGGLLSEASLQGKLNHQAAIPAPVTWDDNLTVLSIGGLLSEASLQAKINNNKSDGGFISDSLDAMVSSHVKTNCSSILDAEETCHAFAFRKFSSSTKNIRVTARSTQDSTSNPFRFPHLPEAENACGPQQFGEDSRSLGLRGITWNESLGPFDLGNSMPWKVFGGGNV